MLEATVSRLTPSTNGTAHMNAKSKRPAKSAPTARPSLMPTTARCRVYLTVTMGVFIPLLSLGLSHVGGTLCRTDNPVQVGLGVGAFGIMACVLAVSLSHLAWAVENITKSPQYLSWLLAVAFDLALVLGELVQVSGAEETGIVSAIMVAVCGLSMVLNVWAFLKSPAVEERRKKGE